MSFEPTAARKPSFRRAIATVAVFALAAVVVGTVLILANYVNASLTRSDARIEALSARIDALTESQKLVVAQMEAQGKSRVTTATARESRTSAAPAATAHSVVPFSMNATDSNMGVHVAIVRFSAPGVATRAGWPVTLRYGNYLDGMSAFNTACKNGDVFQGQYYVDASTQTVSARLLRGAAVTVYGWTGAGAANGSSHIAAADLVRVLGGAGVADRPWKNAWFWVKIGPHGEVLSAIETPPQ
jgi:hypothetical protein